MIVTAEHLCRGRGLGREPGCPALKCSCIHSQECDRLDKPKLVRESKAAAVQRRRERSKLVVYLVCYEELSEHRNLPFEALSVAESHEEDTKLAKAPEL